MNFEVESVQAERTHAFWKAKERDMLSTLYDFRVVWHEQTHELAATREGEVVGALRLRIAASLAHLESLAVLPVQRRNGIGRALLTRAEEIANYYNCHKVTAQVPAAVGEARAFLEACSYKVEAVLPQHTFKLDMAVMRKFLL